MTTQSMLIYKELFESSHPGKSTQSNFFFFPPITQTENQLPKCKPITEKKRKENKIKAWSE